LIFGPGDERRKQGKCPGDICMLLEGRREGEVSETSFEG